MKRPFSLRRWINALPLRFRDFTWPAPGRPRQQCFRPGLEVLEDRTLMNSAPIPTLFSTGVDNSGNLLAAGAADPHWTITSAPSPDSPGSASVVTNNGFPFAGYWVANTSTSQWIAPHANENDLTSDGTSEPVGNFTYETTFSLQGFDPSTATISGQWTDDNTLMGVYLNGSSVGISSTNLTDYTSQHSFTISGGFQPGINTLDFVVLNQPQTGLPNNEGNPSALQVQLSGTARPAVPPPLAPDPGCG